MSEGLREHLLATIAHLTTRRSALLVELAKLDDIVTALIREEESIARPALLKFPPHGPRTGTYAGISIRWAVLWYLSEHTERPEPSSVIAEALKQGGSATKAQNFNSNVSAILSTMMSKDEVAKLGDCFFLTDHGKGVWHGIKNSEKFLKRSLPSTGGQDLHEEETA